MSGLNILVRSLSADAITASSGRRWQYHPQSDRHSKIACWGIVFDLLQLSPQLRAHVLSGKVAFGINHTMTNFVANKNKDLDLVLCTPAPGYSFARSCGLPCDDAARKWRLCPGEPSCRAPAVL